MTIHPLNNLLKNGVTTNKDGSVTVGGLTVKKKGEVSVNSPDVVYGKNAKIIWDSNNTMGQISIGNNATAITGRGGQESSFAWDGDYNHAAGAIAIGANTYARTGSIMIGSHVYKGNMGDVKNIDTDSFNTGSDGAYGFTVNSTTIGTNSFTRGNLATTIGDYNIQSGRSVGYGWQNALNYGAQNFGATVIGALNSNESQSDIVSSYFGTSTSGVANSIVGVANRVNSSNGTLVFGAGNEVTHSLSDIHGVGDTTSLKDAKKAQDALKNAVAKSNAGGAVLAIGGANKADWARKSQLIGVGNTLTGASSAVSEYNMINGYKNEVTNATHTSIIGSNNNARDVQATTVMGDNNALTGNGNHVIGDNHKVTGKNNILIGNNKEQETHSGSDSVIIGNNASAGIGSMVMGNEAHAGNTGIALGMNASAGNGQNLAIGYYAKVSGAKNSTALGYASKVEKRDILLSDGEDGVISVGKSVGQSGEAGITRRIINVKAGVNDTDAVNVSQLKGVKAEALKHSTVTNGDANITVTEGLNKDGGKEYKVALNNDITLAGDDPDAFVSISGSKGTIWTSGSVTAGSVAVGTAKADGTTPFFVDSNGAFYAANGKLVVDKDGKLVAPEAELGKVTVAVDGKISGVAAGEVSSTSTDAINGSQLHQTNENVAALDKRVTQNEADIAQNKADIATNKADIATNKANIAQNAADIKKVEALAKKHTTVAAGDNITVSDVDPNADGGKEYKVALNKDINLDSVTTGQTVMNNDGLKVDKNVSVTATAVTAGQTSISNDGLKVNGKTYVSDSGLNANDQKITNVADGKVEKGSTDAVNGGQLYNETRVAKDGNFVKKSNTAGENLSALDNQVTANTESIYHMNGRISDLDNRVNKVGAGAAALAALHPLDFDPDAKWDFAAGYGNYRGANAAAVGAYYRPNEDTMFSVGGSFGNGENMVNAGVSFKLGSGSSHVSTSRVAMAKEIKELRGELEAMKSAMLDANAGKKIDTSKLQLFPDVPQNHWAYEYVAQLAGNGMIEGYPDGNFAGDRPMTRYEFAAILYRAMTKGAVLSDKILSEFSHELEYFTVDTIAKDKAGNPTIQRVRTVKENKNK